MRERDNTSCDVLTSQVATNGNRTSTPTKHASHVSPFNMCMSKGIHTQIARSEKMTRSRKRSLHQATTSNTIAIYIYHASSDNLIRTHNQEAK
jgi:hypothetical protein